MWGGGGAGGVTSPSSGFMFCVAGFVKGFRVCG